MSTSAFLRLLYVVAGLSALAMLSWFFGRSLPDPLKLPVDGSLVIHANLILCMVGLAVLGAAAMKWRSVWRALPASGRLKPIVAFAVVLSQVLYVSAVLIGLSRSTDL